MLTVATFSFFLDCGDIWYYYGVNLAQALFIARDGHSRLLRQGWPLFIYTGPSWFFAAMTRYRVGFQDAARVTANSGSVKRSGGDQPVCFDAVHPPDETTCRLISNFSFCLFYPWGALDFLLMLHFCSHALVLFADLHILN